jgi:hypothetical protein
MHGTLQAIPRPSNKRRPTSRPKYSKPLPVAFGDLARFVFPIKTIEALGHITGAGRSTIKDWLNGKHAPDGTVLALVTAELMRQVGSHRR